ncbi:hypothetical protein TTHERM_001046821 (macronuclear) [Tetrahymena thermophila SB210]|uniref:Uncharacterized protein n=1 Tax=Tetrahymena thermophila (strain SB210) TaxID=312017 RepID=W7XBU1_TETTS|nr:hypothetical protein TTHERM_001046821 [Tetrahymena thermophila SB210]EWS73893.1 hypothetical protein TTHERM_001046821 [Tetrahymena thermophila SB210]|eukprot:XP_012653561.1 hypothetical protein TTHERM_001046821 [Tetrahymena thermophila SB210]
MKIIIEKDKTIIISYQLLQFHQKNIYLLISIIYDNAAQIFQKGFYELKKLKTFVNLTKKKVKMQINLIILRIEQIGLYLKIKKQITNWQFTTIFLEQEYSKQFLKSFNSLYFIAQDTLKLVWLKFLKLSKCFSLACISINKYHFLKEEFFVQQIINLQIWLSLIIKKVDLRLIQIKNLLKPLLYIEQQIQWTQSLKIQNRYYFVNQITKNQKKGQETIQIKKVFNSSQLSNILFDISYESNQYEQCYTNKNN